MSELLLRSAAKHRAGGPWDADDYDVYADGVHVGRIMLHPQAPAGAPWFWTITARFPQKPAERGYAVDRAGAMAAFRAAWEAG